MFILYLKAPRWVDILDLVENKIAYWPDSCFLWEYCFMITPPFFSTLSELTALKVLAKNAQYIDDCFDKFLFVLWITGTYIASFSLQKWFFPKYVFDSSEEQSRYSPGYYHYHVIWMNKVSCWRWLEDVHRMKMVHGSRLSEGDLFQHSSFTKHVHFCENLDFWVS